MAAVTNKINNNPTDQTGSNSSALTFNAYVQKNAPAPSNDPKKPAPKPAATAKASTGASPSASVSADGQPVAKTALKTEPTSTPAPAAAKAPSKADEQAADVAGAKAVKDYQSSASTQTGRDALSTALTGKSVKDLPAAEQSKMTAFLDQVAAGKATMPEFTSAATGSATDVKSGNATLGNEILLSGASGAYVESKNVALLSNTLKGKELDSAAREEAGEALAAAAKKAGIDVKEGDVGARLEVALAGKPLDASMFVADAASDKTLVNIDGAQILADGQVKSRVVSVTTRISYNAADRIDVEAKDAQGQWRTIGMHMPFTIPGAITGDLYGNLTLNVKDYPLKGGYPEIRIVNHTDTRDGRSNEIYVTRSTATVNDSKKGTRVISFEDRPGKSYDFSNVKVVLQQNKKPVDNAIIKTTIQPTQIPEGGPPDRLPVLVAKLDNVPVDLPALRQQVARNIKQYLPPLYPGQGNATILLNETLTNQVTQHAATLVKAGAKPDQAAKIAGALFGWGTSGLVVGARYDILKNGLAKALPLPNLDQIFKEIPATNRVRIGLYAGSIAATYTVSASIAGALKGKQLYKNPGDVAAIAGAASQGLNLAAVSTALYNFGGLALHNTDAAAIARSGYIAKGAFQLADITNGAQKIAQAFDPGRSLPSRMLKAMSGLSAIMGGIATGTTLVTRWDDYGFVSQRGWASTFGLGLSTALDMANFYYELR